MRGSKLNGSPNIFTCSNLQWTPWTTVHRYFETENQAPEPYPDHDADWHEFEEIGGS